MQSDYPNTALRLIELGRDTTSSRPDATIESYAETRIAQVLESQDANALAAKHYIRKVVPVCEWNDVRPAWAAISLIAAAKSISEVGHFELAASMLEDIRLKYSVGLSENLIIESDLLGAELQVMAKVGEESDAYKRWSRLRNICLQNGYPIVNHISAPTLLRLKQLDWMENA
jgi:hypothetical protein